MGVTSAVLMAHALQGRLNPWSFEWRWKSGWGYRRAWVRCQTRRQAGARHHCQCPEAAWKSNLHPSAAGDDMEGASQPTCTNHGLQRFVIVASMMMLKNWFGT